MKTLGHIWKWIIQLCGPWEGVPNAVDSHKWESKMQVWACMSSRPR